MSVISNNILITGVSSGIGLGVAREALHRGYRVFGSVRNDKDAQRLSSELGNQFTPVVFDVTSDDEVQKAYEKISVEINEEGLAVLINNAGVAVGGPLLHQSMDEIQYHFEVNVFGLLRVIKVFSPLLGARSDAPYSPGRIINISSVGGKIASPFVAAYVGTKHAVEGISVSLRRELLMYGIDVIVVGPGSVQTPIWDKGINMESYKDTDYGRFLKRFAKAAMRGAERGLTIDKVGKSICDIMEKERPKTRYTLVANYFGNWIIPRIMPDRLIDRYIKKNLYNM